MSNTEKEIRLKELQQRVSTMTNPPAGLLLAIEKLKQELGLSDTCDLDGDCLNCGS